MAFTQEYRVLINDGILSTSCHELDLWDVSQAASPAPLVSVDHAAVFIPFALVLVLVLVLVAVLTFDGPRSPPASLDYSHNS